LIWGPSGFPNPPPFLRHDVTALTWGLSSCLSFLAFDMSDFYAAALGQHQPSVLSTILWKKKKKSHTHKLSTLGETPAQNAEL
jgi:hypothetical protein